MSIDVVYSLDSIERRLARSLIRFSERLGSPGEDGSVRSAAKYAGSPAGSAITFASYVGVEASTSTSPVRGSSMTIAPLSFPSRDTASFWRGSESDVRRSFPRCRRDGSRWSRMSWMGSGSRRPVSSASKVRSRPADPYRRDAYPTTPVVESDA